MNAKTLVAKRELSLLSQYLLYLSAFAIPFLFGHPQMVVGSVVNMLLIMAAARLPSKHMLPLAVLPSLAAVARGVLFGPYTAFLTYFLPFIWLGNLALMLLFRRLGSQNEVAKLGLAAGLKAAVLFSAASLYVQMGWVPEIFTSAMGLVQLQSALVGGLAGLAFLGLMDRSA